MSETTILQIFIVTDIFVMGALVVFAGRHLYAHLVDHHKINPPAKPAKPSLSLAVRERLMHKAETDFEAALNHSVNELQGELATTISHLNKQLEQLGSSIIKTEMSRYQYDVNQMRKQADGASAKAQAEIDQHQTELKIKLAVRQSEMEAELKEKIKAEEAIRLQEIDTKLSDAVMSFLTETLGHDVDLGAQSQYILKTLDEHKDELKKGVSNEA